MNKAVKAALISAFVCPGGGHFYLKQYTRGTLLSVTMLGGLLYLLDRAVERAHQITDRILSGELAPDLNVIYGLITQAPDPAQASMINLATSVFFIAWFVGVIDSYRLGHGIEKKQSGIHDS
ncbi:DUF6677 family protein [uncultured Shewanella sp.]|uniref:DUF6677 family protein n=1 Tax=Shewanella atlantica TaxID=271099 RepID=UPI00261EBAB5|nr:DUF6677 family protein [uncultured Shewanella sp.]